MAVPTAKFTLDAAQKIADFIHKGQQTPDDNTGTQSIRRSFSEHGFWAQITANCTLSANRWKYSFEEMCVIQTGTGFGVKPSGRTGDCTSSASYPAINSIEANNTATSPVTQPVPNGVIVWMRQDFPTVAAIGDDRPPHYEFAYEQTAGLAKGQVTLASDSDTWPSACSTSIPVTPFEADGTTLSTGGPITCYLVSPTSHAIQPFVKNGDTVYFWWLDSTHGFIQSIDNWNWESNRGSSALSMIHGDALADP